MQAPVLAPRLQVWSLASPDTLYIFLFAVKSLTHDEFDSLGYLHWVT